MRINRLDLNQLACLEALLQERNVSRAARRVHLSQPALSATLARMRDFFGDPLLVPTGRTMSLSPFAQSLLEPLRDLLLQAQALSQRRPEADPARIERQVTVVGSDYVLRLLMGPVTARAAREAPGLRFDLRSIGGYLAEELDQGDVDLVVSSASAITPSHPSEVLMRDAFCCVAWAGHSTVQGRLSRAGYLQSQHVTTVLGRGRVPTVDQLALDALGLQRQVAVQVPAFTLLPACIVGTDRIATLQRSLAEELAAQGDLQLLPCPIPIPDIVIAVQWHRYQSHDRAIVWVREALHGVAREVAGRQGQAG